MRSLGFRVIPASSRITEGTRSSVCSVMTLSLSMTVTVGGTVGWQAERRMTAPNVSQQRGFISVIIKQVKHTDVLPGGHFRECFQLTIPYYFNTFGELSQ